MCVCVCVCVCVFSIIISYLDIRGHDRHTEDGFGLVSSELVHFNVKTWVLSIQKQVRLIQLHSNMKTWLHQ